MSFKTKHKIINGDSRQMTELVDKSIDLVITSPPYWQLKDYGIKNQIGYNDSYEEYINNLKSCLERKVTEFLIMDVDYV